MKKSLASVLLSEPFLRNRFAFTFSRLAGEEVDEWSDKRLSDLLARTSRSDIADVRKYRNGALSAKALRVLEDHMIERRMAFADAGPKARHPKARRRCPKCGHEF